MFQQLAAGNNPQSSLKASTGHTKYYIFEVSVAVPHITVFGSVKGTVDSYDFKSIYSAYSLKDSDSPSVWAQKFSADPNHEKLVEANENSVKVVLDIDMQYKLIGNSHSISKVYIYYSTIEIASSKGVKRYIVANASSATALDSHGSPYTGFKVVSEKG